MIGLRILHSKDIQHSKMCSRHLNSVILVGSTVFHDVIAVGIPDLLQERVCDSKGIFSFLLH